MRDRSSLCLDCQDPIEPAMLAKGSTLCVFCFHWAAGLAAQDRGESYSSGWMVL